MTKDYAIEILQRELSDLEPTHAIAEALTMAITALRRNERFIITKDEEIVPIKQYKDVYNQGYYDGQQALIEHLRLCREEAAGDNEHENVRVMDK